MDSAAAVSDFLNCIGTFTFVPPASTTSPQLDGKKEVPLDQLGRAFPLTGRRKPLAKLYLILSKAYDLWRRLHTGDISKDEYDKLLPAPVITGLSGAGKSRLASECIWGLLDEAATLGRGRGSPLESVLKVCASNGLRLRIEGTHGLNLDHNRHTFAFAVLYEFVQHGLRASDGAIVTRDWLLAKLQQYAPAWHSELTLGSGLQFVETTLPKQSALILHSDETNVILSRADGPTRLNKIINDIADCTKSLKELFIFPVFTGTDVRGLSQATALPSQMHFEAVPLARF
jgi:hypothetical protein